MIISLLVFLIIFGFVIYRAEFESYHQGLVQCKAETRWSVLPHVDKKSLVEEVEEISQELTQDKQ